MLAGLKEELASTKKELASTKDELEKAKTSFQHLKRFKEGAFLGFAKVLQEIEEDRQRQLRVTRLERFGRQLRQTFKSHLPKLKSLADGEGQDLSSGETLSSGTHSASPGLAPTAGSSLDHELAGPVAHTKQTTPVLQTRPTQPTAADFRPGLLTQPAGHDIPTPHKPEIKYSTGSLTTVTASSPAPAKVEFHKQNPISVAELPVSGQSLVQSQAALHPVAKKRTTIQETKDSPMYVPPRLNHERTRRLAAKLAAEQKAMSTLSKLPVSKRVENPAIGKVVEPGKPIPKPATVDSNSATTEAQSKLVELDSVLGKTPQQSSELGNTEQTEQNLEAASGEIKGQERAAIPCTEHAKPASTSVVAPPSVGSDTVSQADINQDEIAENPAKDEMARLTPAASRPSFQLVTDRKRKGEFEEEESTPDGQNGQKGKRQKTKP